MPFRSEFSTMTLTGADKDTVIKANERFEKAEIHFQLQGQLMPSLHIHSK